MRADYDLAMNGAHGVTRPTNHRQSIDPAISDSIPNGVHSQAKNAINQLRVGEICFERGLREIFIACQHRIGICLDKIDFIFRGEPQIQPRVTINRQQTINALTRLLDLADYDWIEASAN